MAHTAEMRVGDVGTEIQFQIRDQANAVVDITSASTKTIYLIKPDGTVLTKVATGGKAGFPAEAVNGWMHYVTIIGDIDQRGTWWVEGYILLSGKELTSEPDSLLVERPKRG